MTQSPAGWYPDPDPTYVGPPGRLRYWDGATWTEHTHDPQPPAPPSYPDPSYPNPSDPDPSTAAQGQQPASDTGFAPIGQPTPATGLPSYPSSPADPQPPYGQAPYGQPPYGQAPYGQSSYGQAPYGAYPAQYGPEHPSTPDGQRLAGWWQRVLATILDTLIQIPLIVLAAIPVIASQWDELTTWFDDLSNAAENGAPSPPSPAIFDISTGPGIALVLSGITISALYAILFLRWKQATPGKLIVGLRVRRREDPSLPMGTILARVGFVLLLNLGAQVIGFLILAALLDVLWPLWDKKKQALHDKVAGTNVVRAS